MNNKNKKSGFGLVEVLIASTIIIVVISSFTFVARGTLAATGRTQDRIQAANLAAEGIEIVRSIRDTNWIDQGTTTGWGNWVGSSFVPITSGSTYKIGPVTATRFYLVIAPAGENIIMNGATFNRKIKVESIVNASGTGMMPGTTTVPQSSLQGQSYKVSVEVASVDDPRIDLTISEVLTNWRPNF